jgi:hypothetical protein
MATGRPLPDIAVLVVRDYLALSQSKPMHQTVIAPAASQYAPAPAQHQAFHSQHQLQQHQQQQLQQQHFQQQHHQQLQQHFQPAQQVVGIPQGIDFSNGGGGGSTISVEPTPVSQLRSMTGMAQQHQQQQNTGSPHQYQQVQPNPANGQQFVVYNSGQ